MAPQLISALLALQFVAFGWRLTREIAVGDDKGKIRLTWLPLPDYLNLLSLLAVVTFCIVLPITGCGFPRIERTALGSAYTLIALHPINEAAHYRLLFSKEGRAVYLRAGKDFPWITGQEIFTVVISVILATFACCAV